MFIRKPISRLKILSFAFFAFLLLALAFYLIRFAPLANRIVGSWPSSDSTQTTVTTFKPNGEWESVTTWNANWGGGDFSDGSGIGRPSVFKGHYSTHLNTFHTFDITRYVRVDGKDIQWMPSSDCNASNTCGSDSETRQMDKEASDPKNFSTILSADWWKGEMRVRSSPSGTVTVWIRQ